MSERCPNESEHARMPSGVLARQDWMRAKAKTHRQVKCRGCGLFVIWVPKKGGRRR